MNKEEPKEVKYELPEEFKNPSTVSVTSSGSGYTNITNATVAAKPI